MTDRTPAQMDIRPGKPPLFQRLSLIWLVPALALGVSLWVAYQNYRDQGILIEIAFENASGIGKETKVKYRDVDIGEVEKVEFADGLSVVLVHVRIDQGLAPYLDDDAQFWVVRPDVSVRGISGLDTVLSGVYIEGSWDQSADEAQLAFTGLETPPLTRAGQRGTEIVLNARDGASLTKGAPILHKGIQVGYLEAPQLATNGSGVSATAFIEEPYNRLVTSDTRFWDTSGFSVSVGAGGISLDVGSIAALIEGGIAFDTIVSGGTAIRDGQQFDIFKNEATARESVFIDPNVEVARVAVLFNENVTGLTKGSEVRFQGIRVGQVEDLSAVVVGANRVRLRATLALEPGRIGMSAETTPEDTLIFLGQMVDNGLRARLATGNILSGALVVELVEVSGALPGQLDLDGLPYPTMPTTASAISDVAATAEGLLERVDNLPVEELMQEAIDLMDSIDRIARSEALVAAPDELLAILQDLRGLSGSTDIQALPADIRQVIADVDALLGSAGTIVTQVENAGLPDQIARTLEAATTAIGTVDTAVAGIDGVIAELEKLTAKANALDLAGLVEQSTATLSAIDALAGSEATQTLPANVNAVLDEVRGLVADVRTGGSLAALEQALSAATEAAAAIETSVAGIPELSDQATALLTQIDAATENLPAIMAEIEALTAKANALEVETLLTEASATLANFNALATSEATRALTGEVNAVLDETRGFIADVRTSGAIANLNEALAAATEAAQSVETGIAGLPELSDRANTLLAQIEEATVNLPKITADIAALTEKANSFEVEALIAQTTETLESIEALVGSEETAALPGSLSAALDELQGILKQLQDGGAVNNVNAVLASANDAARAIEEAAQSLPALSSRATRLVGQTEAVLATYGDRSRFNAETLQTLRDIQETADALTALARTIQRNPNSLLTGR